MEKVTYRVRDISPEVTLAHLKAKLQEHFEDDESRPLEMDIVFVPSYHPSSDTKNALLRFRVSPRSLKPGIDDKVGVRQVIMTGWGPVTVDSHFLGLTVVSSPVRPELDIVFLAGIDGHALGSWTSRNTGLMWPRDMLSQDIPTARVMLYGYNIKFGAGTAHTLDDYCTQFLASLKLAREGVNNRKLMLVAHDYGGRIVTRCVVKCKVLDSDGFHKGILTSLSGIIFFGSPHHGIDTKDMEMYLNDVYDTQSVGDPRKSLVAELHPKYPATKRELHDFKDLVGQVIKATIITIYERKPSRRLVQSDGRIITNVDTVPSNSSAATSGATPAQVSAAALVRSQGKPGSWVRQGELYHPLPEESALLGFPLWMEKRIPSESDHSNMAKFDARDETYLTLLHEILSAAGQGTSSVEPATGQLAQQIPLATKFEEPRWIPFESLYFAPDNARSNRSTPSLLQSLFDVLSPSDQQSLRLRSKRSGLLLDSDGSIVQVLVEFRPFPHLEDINHHYDRRKQFEEVARIIANSAQGTIQFPALPLVGISVWNKTPDPCFLFIYESMSFRSLNECLRSISKPPVQLRLRIALQCARAVAALHEAEFWHGLLNCFNIFVEVAPPSGRRPSTVRAGDTAAEFDGSTILLDGEHSVRLAGFEMMRAAGEYSDLVDVEDRHQRMFLHAERLGSATIQERQRAVHDVFSLGVVMIAIGLWTRFDVLRKYQEASDEDEARSFVQSLRKRLYRPKSDTGMPSAYAELVSHCLGQGSAFVMRDDAQETPSRASLVAQQLSEMIEQ